MSNTNNSTEFGEGNVQADRNYRVGVQRTVSNTTHEQRAELARAFESGQQDLASNPQASVTLSRFRQMMELSRRQFLIQINRVLILTLSVFGMSMDGFATADAVLALALVIWLWMPLFIRIESRVFGKPLKEFIRPRKENGSSPPDSNGNQEIHPNPNRSTP